MKNLELTLQKIVSLLSHFGKNAKCENGKIHLDLIPERVDLLNREFKSYFTENKGISYPQFRLIPHTLSYELIIQLYCIPYSKRNKPDIERIEQGKDEIYKALSHVIHNLQAKHTKN